MKAIELEEDDGFITVTFGGVEQQLDLYQVHNRLNDMAIRLQDKPGEWLAAIVEYLSELGLPGVSQRQACKFNDKVLARMDELGALAKKKAPSSESVSPTPNLSDSTVSRSCA